MDRPGPQVLARQVLGRRYAGQRADHPAAGDCLTRDALMARPGGGATRRRACRVLDDLAGMVRLGEDVFARDPGTGEDTTRSILTPISSPITEH
jgi:hypothetical protein